MPFLPDRCLRYVRRATRRLAEEHGISLLLALISLAVLSTVGGGVAVYTSSNLRHAYSDRSSSSSYQLAEAGLADALSVLKGATGTLGPTDPTLLPLTTRLNTTANGSLGGTYTYQGTAVSTPVAVPDRVTWTITATGTAAGSTRKTTLTQTAVVRPLVPGADLGSWSRFYQDSTSCLTIDTITMPAPLATKGDLCLVNRGTITGAGTAIDIGGKVVITGPTLTGTTHVPASGAGWTGPTNVYANDSVYATNTIAAVTTGANQDTTNFTLGLPAGAEILGIRVQLERVASVCCNVNEVQTISETGNPTAGSFTLTGTPPGGTSKTSATLARNATAAQVQTALTASTMYGAGNVACTGGPLPTTTISCTFQGAYASMPVSNMTFTKVTTFAPTTATPVMGNPTNGVNANLQDSNVQLLKAGVPVGNNKAVAGSWSTTPSVVTYGSSADLWGTTWTAADLNATNFGLRFAAKNLGAGSATASLDWVTVQVTYNDDTAGIGTAATPIHDATIGGTCEYNGVVNKPCTSADHVYAGSIVSSTLNPDLIMPKIDLSYWFTNAKPGPKHFCTNSNNTLTPLTFDNDGSAVSNDSQKFDNSGTYDMTPLNRNYDCEVVENGVPVGVLAWNHSTHVLTIGGTIFFDGDVRFDDDGQLIHYQGRAMIYAAGNVEFDELVCAGGSGTASSCAVPASNMSNWDASQNYLTIMAEGDAEYDQGGSGCSGLAAGVTCNGTHPQSGFQGVVSAAGKCTIHQNFYLSGPVVCGVISLPPNSGEWPTYFPFPSLSDLVDGQKYGDLLGATSWEIKPGPQTG